MKYVSGLQRKIMLVDTKRKKHVKNVERKMSVNS